MRNLNKSILDNDKIGPLLFKLALPSFIGMFVVTMYNVINTIFIGHYVGYLGIAGSSIVFPYQMLGLGLGQMMGMGGASLISRLIGNRNIPKAEHALGNALVVNMIISLVMTAIGLANPDYWLKLAGASEEVLPYARDYMVIIFAGMIFNNFVMAANGLTVSQGNTRVPMIAQIMGAVLNIIMDSIFVIWLRMGVRGAAMGTVIAQIVSTIFFLVYYLGGHSYLKIHLRNLKPDLKILKEIMAIGVASLAMTLTASLSNIVANRALETYGSDMAMSTMGILSRLFMFAMMPGMVIGQGLQPILGFNYGAKRYDRIIKGIKIALISAISIGLIVFLVLYFFPAFFFHIFTNDPNLLEMGGHAAKRMFLFISVIGFLGVGSMTFVALGKATQSFITSISRTAVFLIPMVLIFGHFWQLDGIWLAYPMSDLLSCGLMLTLLIPQIKDLMRKRSQQLANVSAGLEPTAESEPQN